MIETHDICKHFGRRQALCDLNLTVPEGSAYALVGPNGAGKTTAIRVLMDLLEADRGTAHVLGVDSRRLSTRERAQIGYASENQQLPKGLTIGECLAYLRPFYPRWDRNLETSLVRQFRLPESQKIGHLSHGMRMKTALTCALPFRPKLLVLDEPFSGLDPLVRDDVMAGLLQQAGEMTLLLSSHELAEIEGLATHVGYLDQGRLLFEESMADLSARFREVHVTLDREAAAPAQAPKEWLNVRAVGNVVMFVDSRFSEEELGAAVGSLAGGVRHIDARPMALRSIFTAMALAARDAAEGGAR